MKNNVTNAELQKIITKYEQRVAALAAETAIDIAKVKARASVQKAKASVAVDVRVTNEVDYE